MWKALIAVAAAAVVAGSSLVFAQQPPATGAAIHPEGEYGHEDYDWQPSAEDDQDYGWQHSAEYDQENGPEGNPVCVSLTTRPCSLVPGNREARSV